MVNKNIGDVGRLMMKESISKDGTRFVIGSRVRTKDLTKRYGTVVTLPKVIARTMREWLGVRFDDSEHCAEWHRDLFDLIEDDASATPQL